jgi:LacI family transcriptional regulator
MTMKKLAELAQLDVSTVSRALSGEVTRVAAPTIARIRKLADEHGYRPDPVAASLRSGRSRVVGVLVSTVTDVVMATIFDAIDRAVAEAGYQAVVTSTRDSAALRKEALAGYIDRRVDGIVMADSLVGSAVPRTVTDSGIPFVMALRKSGGHPCVTADDHAGGRLVGEHLLALGHRDIEVLAGPRTISTSRGRLAGFTAATKGVVEQRVTHGDFGVRQGYEAMSALLEAGSRPTAVFAMNDYNAIGAGKALQEFGMTVGEDVALVGYNDIDGSSHLTVPLSSVRNEPDGIGAHAARMIVDRIEGKPVRSLVLPSHLVIRESSRGTSTAR